MMNLKAYSLGGAGGGRQPDDEIPPDAELLARWTSRADAVALEQLIQRHGRMVFGVCRRILGNTTDAEDAFQATFLVLVQKARTLAHPERVGGWLHGVAVWVSRKARADRARRQ